MAAFIRFHVQDSDNNPLSGVFLSATSPTHGPWQALTNDCGDFFTPAPGLGAGHYDISFQKSGFKTRIINADLANSGEIYVGLETDGGALPFPAPTRDEVLSVRVGFQGETVTTGEYGTFPAFGPETTTLGDSDLRSYCSQLRDHGWTHGEIAISWQYTEPGFLMPVPGRDLTNNLPELARRIVIMLGYFKAVVLFLAGDGRSAPKNPDGTYPYNDPVGHTYGFEWLMDNFSRIGNYLKNSPYGDLTKYVLFVPGYDAVFYGWGNLPSEQPTPDLQPTRVVNFGTLFRQTLPDGFLGIEHSTGKIPVGEGGMDWVVGGRMQTYDVILSEFDWWNPGTPAGDSVWQIVGRLNRPYNRPSDQPAGDDPNPPFYLANPNPRGKIYYCAYEYGTFQWTRGKVSADDVNRNRQYLRNLGVVNVC